MKPFTRILINIWAGYNQWELRQQLGEIMKEPLAEPTDPEAIAFRAELDRECIRIWSSPGYIDIDAMIRYEKRKAG